VAAPTSHIASYPAFSTTSPATGDASDPTPNTIVEAMPTARPARSGPTSSPAAT
jgi:hypothetical protein